MCWPFLQASIIGICNFKRQAFVTNPIIRRKYSKYNGEVNKENKFISNTLFVDVLKSKKEGWELDGDNTVDQALRDDKELMEIAQDFKDDEKKYLKVVEMAWNKLANFDR